MYPGPLFPRLADPDDGLAIQIADVSATYRQVAGAASSVAHALQGAARVAVWAEPKLESCIAVIGALAAGVTVIPINPGYGSRELEHIVADADPQALLTGDHTVVPPALASVEHRVVNVVNVGDRSLPDVLHAEDTAFVLYTSGTTGPPKGAMIPRRAITSNLDALAEVWQWTSADRLTHALPLFHAHGLILGILGSLYVGGQVEHVGAFSTTALAGALDRGATMVFGVPTMYKRIIDEAEADPSVARSFGKARLLVSGSAPLSTAVNRRFKALTGRFVLERYGLTETLILTAVPPDTSLESGTVGVPVRDVDLRLVDDEGHVLSEQDFTTIGEIVVRGPSLFSGYLKLPRATAQALRGGWFYTGDLATWRPGRAIRIVGRRATDMIKSGGYKIGAGEIEAALLEHPGVAEAAVAGREDPDLGERVVAWIVPTPGNSVTFDELRDHVGALLASYKKPREMHFVDALPRNAMGKVIKKQLTP